jgi:tetraacyldisaccharide 4'-kinase
VGRIDPAAGVDMHIPNFDWARIHAREAFSPLTLPLTLLSLLYGLGVRCRLAVSRRAGGHALPGFVVSLGNITAGGTGKTPACCFLAQWARDAGYRPAVLSRGYGGRFRGEVLQVSDGREIRTNPDESGDEPLLLARKLPGVPVVVSRRRYSAGMWAHEKFGSDFFVLDDGFQHLDLRRDLDLVLIHAGNPFGNGCLLPRGPLREPLSQLARADGFVITRAGHRGPDEALTRLLKDKYPQKPVFLSDHVPDRAVLPARGESHEPGFLRERRVLAFAGIARPESFEETLSGLGARTVGFRRFGDHYAYGPRDIQELVCQKEEAGADYLVTTEKDWMRLEPLMADYSDLVYLSIRFRLLHGVDSFFAMVKDGADRCGL